MFLARKAAVMTADACLAAGPVPAQTKIAPINVRGVQFLQPLVEYRKHEGRFEALARVNKDEANRLMDIAQEAANLRWSAYEKMAARSAAEFPADGRREL